MTDPYWWNYLLAALDVVGLVALLAVGRKKAIGWLWAMITQAVWIVYSTVTFQWGFLAVALVKLGIYTWNWTKWRREAQHPGDEPDLQEQFVDLVAKANPEWDSETHETVARQLFQHHKVHQELKAMPAEEVNRLRAEALHADVPPRR